LAPRERPLQIQLDCAGSFRDAANEIVVSVSFIIPLFNCLALTRACLDSLRATLPSDLSFEIILVDDGSSDGTREWLAGLTAPVRVMLNERNLGYAISNNRGVALAQGEQLVLLNNDLEFVPGWFEALSAAHRSLGTRVGLVGNVQLDIKTGVVDHTGIILDCKAKPEHDRRSPSRWARWFAPVRPVPAVTGACLMISRGLWTQLGGFDEGFINGGEDVDLAFRARAIGRVNAVALRSVIRHHISASLGRKLRDEQNSRRLALRWRKEFAVCAARQWCRDYFEQILREPRDYDPSLARRVWFHALGLTATPPPETFVFLEEAQAHEAARWQKMFGH